jgi:hypothetical protein
MRRTIWSERGRCVATAVALVVLNASAALHARADAPVVAFPGAEGAGQYTKGGRGGAVLKVTSLDDAGPGTLRAAVEATGPRTVVFDISGTIALKSPLRIANPFITIAGQSAPGDGVTLRDQSLIVAADEVIVRYIRSRLGDASGVQGDAVTVMKGRNVILDHISASWSTDEALSLSSRFDPPANGFYDVTVQWSIISESLDHSTHEKGRHGYGTLIRASHGARISFHHNLWAHHQARMPRPGNYKEPSLDPDGPLIDFRNNVFYNWGGDPNANHAKEAPYTGKGRIDALAAGYNADLNKVVAYNFVNNAYKRGPDSRSGLILCEHDQAARAFLDGNTVDGKAPVNQWSLVACEPPAGYRLPAPLPLAFTTPEPAAAAFTRVLAKAGASKRRDAVDARVVREVRKGNGRIIDSQKAVGGWPVLRSLAAPRDSDGDGMPDRWERKHRLDPRDPSDGAKSSSDGYTNLERYLNALVK